MKVYLYHRKDSIQLIIVRYPAENSVKYHTSVAHFDCALSFSISCI